jgi:ankyrin repeat protein
MVRWLLDHDANPYAEDYEGKTPLDRAEANGHEDAAALLKPFFEPAD